MFQDFRISFYERMCVMTRLYSFATWWFSSLAIALAVLAPLMAPENAFADGGMDCNSVCNGDPTCVACCENCPSNDPACIQGCVQGIAPKPDCPGPGHPCGQVPPYCGNNQCTNIDVSCTCENPGKGGTECICPD